MCYIIIILSSHYFKQTYKCVIYLWNIMLSLRILILFEQHNASNIKQVLKQCTDV